MSHCVESLSLFSFPVDSERGVASVPFFRDGKPVTDIASPRCHLTLAAAGSMRFRWNETNPARSAFFSRLCGGKDLIVVPLELVHSRAVYAVGASPEGSLFVMAQSGVDESVVPLCTGDGIISCERRVVPVVTVADCVPIYLYDPVGGCFGVVHSGWKGTGIASEAVALACKTYGSNPADFCAVIGPHIHSCCYTVEKERAELFAGRYGSECVLPCDGGRFQLSLAAANIRLLLDAGVKDGNILHCSDCTCCDSRLGSFRRQTSSLPPELPLEERLRHFTAMAAFVM